MGQGMALASGTELEAGRDRADTLFVFGKLALILTAKVCTHSIHSLRPRRRAVQSIANYTTAGMVRHPFDRFVSCWADMRRPHRVHLVTRNRLNGRPVKGMRAGLSIDEFAEVVARQPQQNRHFIPQHVWLHVGGRLPDHVIRYEHLREDWQLMQQMFPELPDLPTERHNVCEHGPWEEEMTPAACEILRPVYQKDFEIFDYADSDSEQAEGPRRSKAEAQAQSDAGGSHETGKARDLERRTEDSVDDEDSRAEE